MVGQLYENVFQVLNAAREKILCLSFVRDCFNSKKKLPNKNVRGNLKLTKIEV